MERRKDDPETSDFTGRRNLCVEHSERLHVLELAVTGNNGSSEDRERSIVWQLRLLIERQKPMFEFLNSVSRIFWILVPICVAGAVSAIWQVVTFIIRNGKP